MVAHIQKIAGKLNEQADELDELGLIDHGQELRESATSLMNVALLMIAQEELDRQDADELEHKRAA